MKKIFAADVGGTEIKAGVVSCKGELLTPITSYASCADGNYNDIIDNFKHIFLELQRQEYSPDALALAFPGNFDYPNGICLMQNVGKYDSIYGCNLKAVFSDMLAGDEFGYGNRFPIYFINDVSAFAIGAAGPTQPDERVLCICIGTGCGSAFMVNGSIVDEKEHGVPDNGWVYGIPFKDSIIDDYLSKRGLTKITAAAFGRVVEGLELSIMAQDGNIKAIEFFSEFGSNIADALSGIMTSFCPDKLIFGGQIAKSFTLFGNPLSELCLKNNIKLEIITETSQAAIKGLGLATRI